MSQCWRGRNRTVGGSRATRTKVIARRLTSPDPISALKCRWTRDRSKSLPRSSWLTFSNTMQEIMATFAAGERLGPYEVLEPIGSGGMGEVYKARDTRLGRDVAIKVLAERFSERFQREARAIAALNHPNICQ